MKKFHGPIMSRCFPLLSTIGDCPFKNRPFFLGNLAKMGNRDNRNPRDFGDDWASFHPGAIQLFEYIRQQNCALNIILSSLPEIVSAALNSYGQCCPKCPYQRLARSQEKTLAFPAKPTIYSIFRRQKRAGPVEPNFFCSNDN